MTRSTHTAASFIVGDRQIIIERGWLKVARIFDEVWIPKSSTPAEAMVEAVRTSTLGADLFTFGQQLPDVQARYDYHVAWENVAVANTRNYDVWWESLPQESRKNVRKCQKRGVTLQPVAFDEKLIRGIKGIYDETPVRQGRRFWHYGKDLATVKRENQSYLERSQFIGAYLGDELIGFLKMVYVGASARIMQILAKNAHYDKHPMNALLATSIQLCSKCGMEYLIYGQYVYGNKHGSSVTEFKRRNGFTQLLVPHYYVPFTWRGRIAVAARLYRTLGEILPEPVINAGLKARDLGYKYLVRAEAGRS